jgi:hypothetical protein
LFVIYPVSVHADINVYQSSGISPVLHLVKDSRFPGSLQPGYSVSAGMGLEYPRGLDIKLEGTASHIADSMVQEGFIYRGVNSVDGGVTLGFGLPVGESTRGFSAGITVGGAAHYARYIGTNLYFFYPSAEISPFFSFSLAQRVYIRITSPFQWHARRDLSYHFSVALCAEILVY